MGRDCGRGALSPPGNSCGWQSVPDVHRGISVPVSVQALDQAFAAVIQADDVDLGAMRAQFEYHAVQRADCAEVPEVGRGQVDQECRDRANGSA